jgi:hypothetical protein
MARYWAAVLHASIAASIAEGGEGKATTERNLDLGQHWENNVGAC